MGLFVMMLEKGIISFTIPGVISLFYQTEYKNINTVQCNIDFSNHISQCK